MQSNYYYITYYKLQTTGHYRKKNIYKIRLCGNDDQNDVRLRCDGKIRTLVFIWCRPTVGDIRPG